MVEPMYPPPADRGTRRILGIAAIVGAVVLAVWILAYAWSFNGPRVTDDAPYTWHRAPAIFLHNSGSEPATCTVTSQDEEIRTVHIAGRHRLTNLQINGARVDRWFADSATVTCTGGVVTVTWGPVTWLYLVGASAIIPFAAIAVVAFWFLQVVRPGTRAQRRR